MSADVALRGSLRCAAARSDGSNGQSDGGTCTADPIDIDGLSHICHRASCKEQGYPHGCANLESEGNAGYDEAAHMKEEQEPRDSLGKDDVEVPEIIRTRRRNIARNEAIMASLFPQPPSPARESKRRAPPPKRDIGVVDALSNEDVGGAKPRVAVRKSKRLRAESANVGSTWEELRGTRAGSQRSESGVVRIERTVVIDDYQPELNTAEACEKLKGLKEMVDAREEVKAGSASYSHCLHRVETMSDKALARRVRAIERARGKQAAEKMLVFVNVLRAREKTTLLEAAEAALDRLLRGVPMPEQGG